MINKLLITCLQRNKRLIIPDLGAFIRKNIDGVGVILVFVPFLKKDDGVLLSAIESWAGIEAEDANEILKEYVSQIKNSLDTRGQYVIEGVGVLKYDANGVIYLAKPNEAAPVHQRVLEKEGEKVEEPVAKPQPAPVRDKSREEVLGELAASVNQIVNRSEQEREHAEKRVEQPEPARPEPRRPEPDYGYRQPMQQNPVGSSFYNPSNTQQQPRQQPPRAQSQNVYEGHRNEPIGCVNYGNPDNNNMSQGQSMPQGRAQQREQHRENLYGVPQQPAQPQGQPQQSQQPQGRPMQQQTQQPVDQRTAQPQRPRKAAAPQQGGKASKGGGTNTVFYIAIVALLLAVGVVLYGFIFGKETPLEDQFEIEAVTDNTTNIPIEE